MSAVPRRVSPYQGLTPFGENDAAYFFGREKDSRLIAADLYAARLTLLYGASGVGKSSAIRAGVLPLLRDDSDVVTVIHSAWQTDPLAALRGSISGALVAARPSNSAKIAALSALPLVDCLRHAASEVVEGRIFVILDQFEEYSLYHPTDDEFAAQFSDATAIDDLSVTFMLSLREEAVARLDRFEDRIEGLFDNRRRIEHLDFAAAHNAIEKPVAKYNEHHPGEPPFTVDPYLVPAVLNDVRTEAVKLGTESGAATLPTTSPVDRVEAPYLQLVMTKLWNDRRTRDSRALRLENYRSLGGAQTIVEKHLETVMEKLTEEQRDVAAKVFQYLVTPSGTKIAHTARDLAESAVVDDAVLTPILDALAMGYDRILRTVAALPERPNEPRYEIFHDRLARAILAWRGAHLKSREVDQLKKLELERHRATAVNLVPESEERSFAPVDAPFPHIAKLLKSGRACVVFGAGASASSRKPGEQWSHGAPFSPTGRELARLLAEEADFEDPDRNTAGLAEIASYYATVWGHGNLRSSLKDVLGPVRQPPEIHRLIAGVAASVPLVILTTTFDTLLEQALSERGCRTNVVINTNGASDEVIVQSADGSRRRQPAKEVVFEPETTCVYKLFGSIDADMIVTEEDEMDLFAKFLGGQLPPLAIMTTLTQAPMLIVGMGLSSWTERLLISNLRGVARRRAPGWAVVPRVSIVDRSRWKAAEIDVIDADVADFSAGLALALQ